VGERAKISLLSRALFLLFFFLSTDIRKIKNNSGEQETAENTRWRIMIRCDVFMNLFFFEFWGMGKSVHFSNYLSLSLFSLVVSKSSPSSSGGRKDFSFQLVVADTTTTQHLFYFFFFHFCINSDGTSYAQAMCAPKLNPLIASGTAFSLPSSRRCFFEKYGLARERGGAFRSDARARRGLFFFSRRTKPSGEVYPSSGSLILFLSRALTPCRSFSVLFFSKQINCESTP
jgi:hypothetical protein